MANNIGDFESVPLQLPKEVNIVTNNPIIKVDATSRNKWALVDFSTGKIYSIKDPAKEKIRMKRFPWDIGFQRTKIITNGGLTNPDGIVGIKNMGPIDLDSVTSVPVTGYTQDAKSFGKVLNKAIVDWYLYRTRTHNVESQKNVYALRMAEGGYLKMRILNYYCSRDELECRTVMCGRQEAACYSIEYALPDENGRRFPMHTMAQSVEVETDIDN